MNSVTCAQQAENAVAKELEGLFDVVWKKIPKPQIDVKTMGGRQFWGDVRYFHGYRIQQNILTEHFRLLDPADVRKAWGTREECEAFLAKIAQEQQFGKMNGRAVIFVHGIIRSSKSFAKMSDALRQDGYIVIGFDYPSTRITMAESAEYLTRTIDSLEGIDEINFVCHSMGGLLVRSYLGQQTQQDPRIKRMVMLGTPNMGAHMANVVKDNKAFQWIFGPAGQELVIDEEGVIAGLPTPDFEFGIIAGARGNPQGWNPLVPGDDDGTVSVESAQLPGAKDFTTVTSLHSFMIEDSQAIEFVRNFLATGAFQADGVCRPIPANASESQ